MNFASLFAPGRFFERPIFLSEARVQKSGIFEDISHVLPERGCVTYPLVI